MDRPFLITSGKGLVVAKLLPAEYVLTGWEEYGANGSDDYMALKGKIGICFECGSSDKPDGYTGLAKQAVTAYLGALGQYSAEIESPVQKTLKVVKIVQKQSKDFVINQNYTSFDKLTPGNIFASQKGINYTANENSHIIFPKTTRTHW